ncbi:flavodoxin [Halobacillus fulvus]|nr:flavodoxin [Halobacillus fulvus]
MADILIAFASMSGNTEEMADLIQSHLDEEHRVTMEEIEDVEVSTLEDYDVVLLGSYTWNDGDLPYEVEYFYDDLEEVNLEGVGAAAFGSGDSIYPQFCESVYLLEERLKSSGARIITEGWKVDMTPDREEDLERCQAFVQAVDLFLKKVEV